MKRILSSSLMVIVLLVGCLSATGQRRKNAVPTSSNFTIQQLAPQVWAAIHNDHYGKAICNAGIVDLGGKTLIFDPFMTPSAAIELREVAKALTRNKNFFVVNSHHHTDHIRGNQAFLPNVTIFSSNITRGQIQTNEPGEQEWEKKHAPTLLQALRKRMVNASEVDRDELPYWIGYYEGIIESSDHLFTALADYAFDDSLWLEGNKLKVKLVERRNGHTASDVVLLIPSLGISFMGDLLCTNRHPWLSDGDVDGWKKSLKMFYEDTLYHTYVPGHGKVSDKLALKILYDYLSEIESLCANAATDSAQDVLMNLPIPAPYRGWFFGRFYQPNLQFMLNMMKEKNQRNKDKTSMRME